jgi:hypothetical protein
MPYQISHVAAYYLSRAMRIPGGASNSSVGLRVEYWRLIHWYNVNSHLAGVFY